MKVRLLHNVNMVLSFELSIAVCEGMQTLHMFVLMKNKN